MRPYGGYGLEQEEAIKFRLVLSNDKDSTHTFGTSSGKTGDRQSPQSEDNKPPYRRFVAQG